MIPDYVPSLGQLDDLAVVALAMRWMRKDLVKYCEYKGYDPDNYFGEEAGVRLSEQELGLEEAET